MSDEMPEIPWGQNPGDLMEWRCRIPVGRQCAITAWCSRTATEANVEIDEIASATAEIVDGDLDEAFGIAIRRALEAASAVLRETAKEGL